MKAGRRHYFCSFFANVYLNFHEWVYTGYVYKDARFVFKKQMDLYLVKRLGLVVFLTILTASAGWIMVQSGLVDRPWVNAYKLTIHFMLAILVIWAMVKTIADVYCFDSIIVLKSKKITSSDIANMFTLNFK